MAFNNEFRNLNYELLAISQIASILIPLKRNNLEEVKHLSYLLNTLSRLVLNKIFIFLDWQHENLTHSSKEDTLFEISHLANVYYKHIDRLGDFISYDEAYPCGVFAPEFLNKFAKIKTLRDADTIAKMHRDFTDELYFNGCIKEDTRINKCINDYGLEKFLKYLKFYTPQFENPFYVFELLNEISRLNNISNSLDEIIKKYDVMWNYIIKKWNEYIDDLQALLVFIKWVVSSADIKKIILEDIFNNFDKQKNTLVEKYIAEKTIKELAKISQKF